VIHSSRKGYHALWYIGEELLWEYESEHLTEIKDFAQAMIERMNDDTGTPLQGS
jgi:L-arabinose isomerase